MALFALSAIATARDDSLAGLPDPTRPDLGLNVEALLARDPDAKALAVGPDKAKQKAAPVTLPAQLELEYTLVSKSRRIAMINGKALQEGETVSGAKVVNIKPNQVTLSREGEQLVLNLVGYQKKVDETKAATDAKTDTATANAATKALELPGEKGSKDGTKK